MQLLFWILFILLAILCLGFKGIVAVVGVLGIIILLIIAGIATMVYLDGHPKKKKKFWKRRPVECGSLGASICRPICYLQCHQ